MSKQALPVNTAGFIVRDLVTVICDHREELSAIDAAIGDGDHGINMAKGFTQCGERLNTDGDADLVANLEALSECLLEGIGGSMGPLYGSFFMSFGEAIEQRESLDANTFATALHEGADAIRMLGEAEIGDKTLLDTLIPAVEAFDKVVAEDGDFACALTAMSIAAETGKESTRQLQARVGRAARLGERSIGELDAGAASCCLILTTMAGSITRRLPAVA